MGKEVKGLCSRSEVDLYNSGETVDQLGRTG